MKTNREFNAERRPGYGPSAAAQLSRRRSHLSAARAGILDVLIDQPEPCTVAALSALIRQHPNTIREHLDSLVGDRLVARTRAQPQGRGRPAWLYNAATTAGSEPGSWEYAALASALAAHITRTSRKPVVDAIESGREWGRELVRQSRQPQPSSDRSSAVTSATRATPGTPAANALAARREVVSLLDELGFDPTTDARAGVVKLRRCPLLEAAHQHPEVVCGVHLGLVRGALNELGVDPDHTESSALQPFSEPGACRLDLLPHSTTAR